ncbi:MAG: TrkA family potassium uptake protein [Planctomycetales bacterium]|nr:TrkA family potassium uptake protein [Planctomycetales bacterium]
MASNANKRFIVLGLGTFGEALVRQLCKNGCRVTGVDTNPTKVDMLKNELYEAIVADVTELSALEHLDLSAADAVFISLGERDEMTPSLLATLHAKELGAKRIVAKGLSGDHAKILSTLGVDRVVFPETEIATELADRMTWPNVLDYIPIDPDYSVAEVAVPDSLVGKTLITSKLRRQFQILVIAIKDALTGEFILLPEPDFAFTANQLLVIVGRHQDLTRFRELK